MIFISFLFLSLELSYSWKHNNHNTGIFATYLDYSLLSFYYLILLHQIKMFTLLNSINQQWFYLNNNFFSLLFSMGCWWGSVLVVSIWWRRLASNNSRCIRPQMYWGVLEYFRKFNLWWCVWWMTKRKNVRQIKLEWWNFLTLLRSNFVFRLYSFHSSLTEWPIGAYLLSVNKRGCILAIYSNLRATQAIYFTLFFYIII